MTVSRVQSRGQITLPKAVRDEAQIKPGDIVHFRVLGPSRVEVETISVKPLSYFVERYRSSEPYDDDAIREAWHEDAARDVIAE